MKQGGRDGLEKAVTYFSLPFGPETTRKLCDLTLNKAKKKRHRRNRTISEAEETTRQRHKLICINRWESFR